MKYRYILLLLLTSLVFVPKTHAQEVRMKKADRFYDLFKFDKAIEQYKRVLAKKPGDYKALKRLGDSYRLRGNTLEAENYYAQAVKDAQADSQTVFYYAQSLRDNGKYELAKEEYNRYAKMAPGDPRGKSLASTVDKIAELRKDSSKYNVQLVPNINSALSDFSPAFYKDSSLVFPTARSKKKKDNWLAQPFLDLYLAEKTDTGFSTPTSLSGKVNKRYHQGPATFSGDSVMYFTRNNYKTRKMKTGEDDIMKMIIMKSTLKKGDEWEELDNLKFNSTEYSVQHPTLTADGKKMYFSSDMPGGLGGFDLYVIELQADGTWGKPVNLGDGINTKGDEGFPFIAADGTLYFASDSYVGFGGLDIYYAKETNGKWGGVTNMGYPINTSFDDFGLIVKKDNKGGYFSSNRPGGPGSDDIYSFQLRGPELRGIVYDRITGDPIPGADVKLVLGPDTLVAKTTGEKGEFTFAVDPNKTYQIPAGKEGYLPNKLNVNTAGLDENTPPVKIPLDKMGLMLVGNTYEVKVNEGTKMESRIGPLPSVIVRLQDLTTNTVDSVLSDGSGGFAFRLTPEHQYKLDGDKELYFLKSEVNFDTKGKTGGTVTADLELYKFEGTIRLVNIYYDFDKYNIRPDAAKELDRLYGYLVKYPDMVIQMRSHTDCRAGKTYNMILSANRAQSAANYLIKKGMKEKIDMLKNITASGFGESMPIYPNLCSTEQGVRDSQLSQDIIDKHQMNRRTEFYVIKQPKAIHVESSVKPH